MDVKKILGHCDHTLLKQTATWDDIKQIIDDGIKYQTASVCIPPGYVRQAAEYAQGRVKVCTVIGFPNGYNTTAVKVFETGDAIDNGADEIDMVINLGWVKDKKWDEIENEISTLKEICGDNILKVIIITYWSVYPMYRDRIIAWQFKTIIHALLYYASFREIDIHKCGLVFNVFTSPYDVYRFALFKVEVNG